MIQLLVYTQGVGDISCIKLNSNQFLIKTYTYNDTYIITVRYGLNEFIDRLYKLNFDIIIFTAGEDAYAKQIVNNLFLHRKPRYIFTKSHVENGVKKLSRISKFVPDFELEKSYAFDDVEATGSDNPDKLILVDPFNDSNVCLKEDGLFQALRKLERKL